MEKVEKTRSGQARRSNPELTERARIARATERARTARANRMAADADDAVAERIRQETQKAGMSVSALIADAMAELLDIEETVKAMDREWQREAERTEERLAEIQRALDAILKEIREAQEEIRKKAGSVEVALMDKGTIETAARYEQKGALDEIREAQKEHTAALKTMNEVMKGALMVMRGLCRE